MSAPKFMNTSGGVHVSPTAPKNDDGVAPNVTADGRVIRVAPDGVEGFPSPGRPDRSFHSTDVQNESVKGVLREALGADRTWEDKFHW